VIRAHGLERFDHRLALVLEDFGGASLDRCLSGPGAGLDERLTVALEVARALSSIHEQGVIHMDVCPANLVWNQRDGRLKAIDFGISTDLRSETPSAVSLEVIEGTLAYMSPEQTGRMNRVIDSRTDLYSLGATLCWLFTGAPPFAASDPLELAHAHIARTPTPPRARNPEIPEAVERIILKLLAKSAEDRYQSAEGLVHDLEQCLRAQREGRAGPQILGARDVSRSFSIPQKLYGREAEVECLLADFERVADGGRGLTLVAGYSGIGKSALVHEVHKPIVARRGLFASGKFDQFRRSVPFASTIQALQVLIQQLLTEPEDVLSRWSARLTEALGINGQLIVDVIPELELVIGSQPAVAEIKPLEAQNRFNKVFADFIRAFADAEHPLTIFLDDLQWADGPSLDLVGRLLTDRETRHLLLIGAYRDNEVGPAHPLMLKIQALKQAGAQVRELTLGPLSPQHVSRLLADTVGGEPDELGELTRVCRAKTQGNPFFLRRFLHAVHDRGGFVLEPERGAWRWDGAAVEAAGITDNVVDLMSQKIRELSAPTQRALQLAACVGASFELNVLSIVLERTPVEAARALRPAIQAGLVVPRGGDYKFLPDHEGSGALGQPSRVVYSWVHDRIQQAAYALISDDRKEAVHHQLGLRMLESLSPGEREEKLFEIAGHLNLGARLRETTAERDELAELDLEVGRKAIASVAFVTARQFLESGLELVGEGSWERRYRLTLELHTEAARATLLIPDFEATERHFEAVRRHAQDVLDEVRACEYWLTACQAQNQIARGLDAAFRVLHGLGYGIPRHPAESDFGLYLARARDAIGGRSNEQLLARSRNQDPREVAALRLMMVMAPLAYIGDPGLFPLLGLEAVALSARNGDAGPSSFAYSLYATLLSGVLGEYEEALRFGELARATLAKYDAREYAGRVAYVPNCFIVFWTRHLREAWASHTESYRLALENGDHEFAAWSIMKRLQQGFFLGRPLDEQVREGVDYVAACFRLEQGMSGNYAQATLQAMLGLQGQSDDPCQLIGSVFDEREELPRYQAANEAFGLCNYHVTKALLLYLWDRWEEALEQRTRVAPWEAGMLSLYHGAVIELYAGLSHLALAARPGPERAEHLAAADECVAKMETWALHGPENFLHKHRLLAGERAQRQGDYERAEALLVEGIAAAEAQGYLHEQALGEELLGRSWLERGDRRRGRVALARARHLYGEWGARAKVEQLDRTHAELDLPAASRIGTPGAGGTSTRELGDLDLLTVLKSARAISSQVQQEGLLRTLLAILIENAGARSGVFVRETPAGPRVEAEGREEGEVELFADLPLDRAEGVPATVVNLVRRTRETLVLDDARDDLRFSQDAVLRRRGARSVLCVPVEHQGKLVATLYLDHDLSPADFTSGHVRLLELLVAQTAISLENARLYGAMETLVEERTRQLEDAQQELARRWLRDKQKAEAENRAKSFFLATMSHEIRTPLNSIAGLISLMNEDDVPARFRDHVRRVQSASQSLLGIVQNVLDLSRIESGKVDVCREPFRVSDLFARLEAVLLPVAEAKGLALDLRLDPGLPEQLLGDATRLGQILTNLANNAVKFTRRGSVRVEALRLDPCVSPGDPVDVGCRVQFAVCDTGQGIPAEALPGLFDAFTQVDGSTSRSHEGSGLGLAIAKRLSDLMGGELSVESTPGQGSRFRLELDLEPAPAEPALRDAAAGAPLASIAGLRVLVVEDSEANRFVLRELLLRAGVVPTLAASGEEALGLTDSQDAVLMDVHMPGMDGFETTRRLRLDPSLANLPIVAVTADALRETRDRCLAAGMSDVITKPIQAEVLVGSLARCTGRAPARAAEEPATAAPLPDLGAQRGALELLGGLLERRSVDARAQIRALRAELPEAGGPYLARLEQDILRFDYLSASRRLDQLLAHLAGS
jgi:predicted ATPase/signal transduction histidine kinase